MKRVYIFISLLAGLMSLAGFSACEFDDSPEPDHPLYVTYTISAGFGGDYFGPDSLFLDMSNWIKANQKVYDTHINYKTGEASEFTSQDAAAIKHYEEFVPKFKAYLAEVKTKLAAGEYMDANEVRATFYTYAARTQGQDGTLRYEQIEFVYPDNAQ